MAWERANPVLIQVLGTIKFEWECPHCGHKNVDTVNVATMNDPLYCSHILCCKAIKFLAVSHQIYYANDLDRPKVKREEVLEYVI